MAKSTTLMIFTHKACSRSLHPIFYLGVVPGAAQGSGAATQGSAGAARLHPPKHYDCPLSHQRSFVLETRDDVLGVPCSGRTLHILCVHLEECHDYPRLPGGLVFKSMQFFGTPHRTQR